jgi:hypothetical protein
VVGVGLTDDFDAKVVDNEVEGCGMGDVAENAWGVADGDVAIVGKVLDKFDVGKSSKLGKTVHTDADFCKDSVIFDEGSEVIFCHDVVWDGPGWDIEIFILAGVIKRSDEVEIGQVKAEEGGRWSGDDAVEQELGGGEVSCWGVGFTVVVDEVASDGETDAIVVCFLRAMIGADAQIGRFLAWWQLVQMDEMQHVGSFVAAALASLCGAGNFFGAALFPEELVLAL